MEADEMAINCWEFKKCGREEGGINSLERGVCPAAKAKKLEGVNHGNNGGRACWAITGTLCDGIVQGNFNSKLSKCGKCEFFQLVVGEEGSNLAHVAEITAKLK